MANVNEYVGVTKFERAVGNGFKVPKRHQAAVDAALSRLCDKVDGQAHAAGLVQGHLHGLREALAMALNGGFTNG